MSDSRLSTEGTAAHRVKSTASTASSFAYPHGHLGHLNPQQEEALQKFKEVLLERGLLKAGPPASHDDQTLLRYLRARRWVVEDAYTQFKETEDWRAANSLDLLYKTIDLGAYESSRRLYPQWTGRRDRRGIPLYLFEVRHLDSKTVSNYEKEGANSTFSEAKSDGKTPNGVLRLFSLYENLTRFVQPLSTELTDREFPDVPITMSTNIVDISGVGLKQFWNLKGHMQTASTLATAHYPETLDRIFIIGAPMFFSTVWGWIKRWFDPITVSKIFVLGSHEVKPVLESFIEPRNIPKQYGGELDFEYGKLPSVDPSWDGVVQWEGDYKSFPTGPLLWEKDEGSDKLVCISLGSKDGQRRRERVCTVARTYFGPIDEITNTAAAATDAATTTKATTNGDAAADEATQTANETQDDATQTADTTETTYAMEKLQVEEKPAETTPVAA